VATKASIGGQCSEAGSGARRRRGEAGSGARRRGVRRRGARGEVARGATARGGAVERVTESERRGRRRRKDPWRLVYF
jgi:hypothetical protein